MHCREAQARRGGARPHGSMSVTETSTVYIARQAIFDVDQKVVAYELLSGTSQENFATVPDASLATARVVTNALLEMGLAQLTGGMPAFINVPGEFLVGQGCRVLPPDSVVLELLEDEVPDDEVLRTIESYRRDGYRVALDDFRPGDARRELLDIADIVKVDVRATPSEAL